LSHGNHLEPLLVIEAIHVKVVDAVVADEAVVIADEHLDGDVGDELAEVDELAHGALEGRRCSTGLTVCTHWAMYSGRAFVSLVSGLNGSGTYDAPSESPCPRSSRVSRPPGSRTYRDSPLSSPRFLFRKSLLDRLDDREQPGILAFDEQLGVRLA
jgi:hypothetical protein